jgi:arsenite methyltransferase
MTEAIENRYEALAESSCCLSCGTAVAYIDARPGQVCLDLGSGRGTDVLRLAERVLPGGHAYGVDITDKMLETARSTAKKLGVVNATFLRAELAALPLDDASVDWVTSNCVLNHAADKRAVWREIARVLRPGGRFVVSDIYAVNAIPEVYRDDPGAVAECWAGAVPKNEYLDAVAAAGLGDVEILEQSAPYQKGQAEVVSFTIAGARRTDHDEAGPARKRPCCCCS